VKKGETWKLRYGREDVQVAGEGEGLFAWFKIGVSGQVISILVL
jgi:hypothetical protein